MVAVGILLMISFGFALAWLFALIGLSVTNGEAAQAAAFPMLAPLTFASNLFVDPKTMPGWMQGWARHQPVSVTADAVRGRFLRSVHWIDRGLGVVLLVLALVVGLAP